MLFCYFTVCIDCFLIHGNCTYVNGGKVKEKLLLERTFTDHICMSVKYKAILL